MSGENEEARMPDENLGRLRESPEVPSALEERVVNSLRAAGRLAPEERMRRWSRRHWLGVAAGIAAGFAGGLMLPRGSAAASGPRWMVLLYEDEHYRPAEPGHEAERVDAYRRWADDLARRGLLVDAGELAPSSTLLAGPGLPDLPARPVGSLATGFFVIAAADAADAERIARECPHLGFGGRLEVRAVVG